MRRITAITFDLWQTLIIDTPELGKPRAQLRLKGALQAIRDDGFDVTHEQIVEAYRRCYQTCDKIRGNEGDVTFDEQIDIFLRSIGEEMAERLSPQARLKVARRYADSYLERPPQLDEHAPAVLHELKTRGYKLALICNTGATPGATQRVFLERAGLAHFFDALTFSDEERRSKPATEIFHSTLERLNASADEAAHIGDHPRNDVEGAKRAGLAAIWLRREPKELVVQPDISIDSLGQVPEAVARLGDGPLPFLDTDIAQR
ncbi:MAG: HAD family hydrolase [Dehalococcoidia bacterium]